MSSFTLPVFESLLTQEFWQEGDSIDPFIGKVIFTIHMNMLPDRHWGNGLLNNNPLLHVYTTTSFLENTGYEFFFSAIHITTIMV